MQEEEEEVGNELVIYELQAKSNHVDDFLLKVMKK